MFRTSLHLSIVHEKLSVLMLHKCMRYCCKPECCSWRALFALRGCFHALFGPWVEQLEGRHGEYWQLINKKALARSRKERLKEQARQQTGSVPWLKLAWAIYDQNEVTVNAFDVKNTATCISQD